MNYATRTRLLDILYARKHKVFFMDKSKCRTTELAELNSDIADFKKLTESTLDEAPLYLHDHDDIGDILTADEWIDEYRGVGCIPSDGCGHWATETGFSYKHSDIFGYKPSWATHVVWCNN